MNEDDMAYWPTKTQLGYHHKIRSILTPGKVDSYAGIVPLRFPDGIEKNGKIWLAYSVEGVGTKILVAQLARKFDTVGIDLVAMNVNDIICSGARPFAFADYLAMCKGFPEDYLDQLSRGIKKGAEEAGIQIVSGETAVIPEMLQGIESNLAFDMAGSSIGLISSDPVDGTQLEDNDALVGLASSGLHSNGFTLARPSLLEFFRQPDVPCAGYKIKDTLPETGREIGEELLVPTRIYVKEIVSALETLHVHGLAHVTGQGLKKLLRLCYLSDCGLLIDSLPDAPPIMKEIRRITKLGDPVMYNTFNMGIGFVVALPKEEVDELVSICRKNGTNAIVIGKATSKFKNTIRIVRKGGEFTFQGKLE